MSAPAMNVFRILADVSHTLSKCILMWAIHWNRSAEGVSFLTQLMYAVVFFTRYPDLFWTPASWSYWNFTLKIFFTASSIYILALMLKVYPRTRERENSWRLAAYINIGALICAPLLPFIIREDRVYRLVWYIWSYSIVLEAFCILPQLILLRQTTTPTVIDSYYLVALGAYRFFYILNWIYKTAHAQQVEPVRVIFGVIQIAFYIDFAWVYYSRQRVKLRGGGIIDADDLRKGFLVNRFMNQGVGVDEESGPDESGGAIADNNAQASQPNNRWGNRGISISADDTLARADRARGGNTTKQSAATSQGRPYTGHDDGEDAFFSDEDENPSVSRGTKY